MILVPSAPVLARPLMWENSGNEHTEKLLCVVYASQISNNIVFFPPFLYLLDA